MDPVDNTSKLPISRPSLTQGKLGTRSCEKLAVTTPNTTRDRYKKIAAIIAAIVIFIFAVIVTHGGALIIPVIITHFKDSPLIQKIWALFKSAVLPQIESAVASQIETEMKPIIITHLPDTIKKHLPLQEHPAEDYTSLVKTLNDLPSVTMDETLLDDLAQFSASYTTLVGTSSTFINNLQSFTKITQNKELFAKLCDKLLKDENLSPLEISIRSTLESSSSWKTLVENHKKTSKQS